MFTEYDYDATVVSVQYDGQIQQSGKNSNLEFTQLIYWLMNSWIHQFVYQPERQWIYKFSNVSSIYPLIYQSERQ